ncbi:hypothetical protein [Absidia glauca]|uniref:Helitron helicase-like domain-containing protein n=1 Tax=Absidia glauca TaxID=4829 RepID=A0A163MXM6_ABSGL|nr:hypothetical protein [Absidia glauca]
MRLNTEEHNPNSCRCGSTTHMRTTSRHCPLNPNHVAETASEGQQHSTTSTSKCNRCGMTTHARATSRLCPFSRGMDPLHKVAARSLNFQPEDVVGPDVCHEEGESYHRYLLPAMEKECAQCGAKVWINEKLTSSSLSNPIYSICCNSGKVLLPLPSPPPEPMLSIILNHTSSNEAASDLHNTSADSNNLQMERDKVFRISGTIYHKLGGITNPNGQSKFAQVYFQDPEEQLRQRTSLIQHLNPRTIGMIQQIILANNCFSQGLMSAYEQYGSNPIENLAIRIRAAPTLGRRYDVPSCPEIAAMVVENSTDGTFHPHDVVIKNRNGGLRTISSLHPSYMPLHYVLMFPYGEDGWSPDMRSFSGDQQRVISRGYSAYMLMVRDNHYIHHYNRLFQQYVVDNYIRIEAGNLKFLRENQKTLRAEMYNGIGDGADPNQIGSTGWIGYRSAKRDTELIYHYDVQSNLARIKQALPPGQSATDRPDITSRVFHMKMQDLMKNVIMSKCFGEVIGYIATVEFQKRGLPHIHIVVILAASDRPMTSSQYDNFVCAELPDINAHPALHHTVTRSMIHGPCDSRCLKEHPITKRMICSKHYPKRFIEETTLNDDGYPVYKRSNNGRSYTFRRSNFTADSRHVVPYNPYLCQKYNSHINVEMCTSSRAVKYLCKYVTKGSDRSTFNLTDQQEDVDEIQDFQNARYIGPCEAVWRILEFQVHMHSPSVTRPDLHLPGEQMVRFQEGISDEQFRQAVESASTGTKLLAFFLLCSTDPSASSLRYIDVPSRYTWTPETRTWKPRTQPPFKDVVSRIYTASIRNMELYCLRMLLLNVQGPTSYENLRSFEGVHHGTFQDAALARGLLENNDECDKCLEEASNQMPRPSMIRRLFCYILLNCSPSNPRALWDKYKDRMADDYFYAF